MGRGVKRRRHGGRCCAVSSGSLILLVLVIGFCRDRRSTSKRFDPENLQSLVCDRSRYPLQRDLGLDQLTVLINGFSEARMHLLEQHAQAYSASSVVDSVYILWGNTSTPDQVLQNADLDSLGAPIYVVRQPSSSLNHRFLPRTYVKTKAVLVCDDDITIDLQSLQFAFRVWSDNQDRIIGLFPRSHTRDPQTNSWIYTKHADRYSILLTKFMILATEFLYLYTCAMPVGVKEYVDEGMNCEDIAMNFLVSNRSSGSRGPLLVQGRARDWGDPRNSNPGLVSKALSARAGHRKNRGDCITAFEKAWGGMQLRFSFFKAASDLREETICDHNGAEVECDKVGVN